MQDGNFGTKIAPCLFGKTLRVCDDFILRHHQSFCQQFLIRRPLLLRDIAAMLADRGEDFIENPLLESVCPGNSDCAAKR